MNPSDWTAVGYDTIALNGTPLVNQRTKLNFIAGSGVSLTVVDNPTLGTTDVTVATAIAPAQQNTSAVLTASQLGGIIRVDTVAGAGPATLTLPAITAAMDGIVTSFQDSNLAGAGSWNTNALTLTATGGAVIESPLNNGAYSAANGSAVLNGNLGGSISYCPNYANQSWKKV